MSVGDEVLKVIAELAPLEWGRCSRAEGPAEATRPPLTVWRFLDAPVDLERDVQRAVTGFAGRIRWEIRKGGRNWVIQPEAVATYPRRGEFRNDIELAIAFGKDHPDIVREAFEDLPQLAKHVMEQVSASRGTQ